MSIPYVRNMLCCVNPTLPSSYQATFSWYEDLLVLQKAINDIITWVNNYDGVTDEWVKEYVASQLKNINDEITQFESVVNGRLEENERKYLEFTSEITAKVNNILLEVDEKNKAFYAIIVEKVKEMLDEVINKLSEQTPVTNPFTGYYDSLKNVLYMLYDGVRADGITAYNYDCQKIEAQRYDGFRLTAFDYDIAFLEKCHNIAYRVFSSFTGLKTSLQQAFSEIYQALRTGGITASEYDEKDLTAEAYDAKEITAFNYSWNYN